MGGPGRLQHDRVGGDAGVGVLLPARALVASELLMIAAGRPVAGEPIMLTVTATRTPTRRTSRRTPRPPAIRPPTARLLDCSTARLAGYRRPVAGCYRSLERPQSRKAPPPGPLPIAME